jgi:hypothetical protein
MQLKTNNVKAETAKAVLADEHNMRSAHGQAIINGLVCYAVQTGQLNAMLQYIEGCEDWGGDGVWDDNASTRTITDAIADYELFLANDGFEDDANA